MAAQSSAPKGESGQAGLPEGFDVKRPQRGARDGYYYEFIELNKAYSRIIESMQGTYDPRLRRIVRQMIGTVVDDNLQIFLWNLIDGIEHNIDKDTSLKPEARNNAKMDLCDLILGQISSYYDQFVGVTHRLKAGVATPPPGSNDDEMELSEEDCKKLYDASTSLLLPQSIEADK